LLAIGKTGSEMVNLSLLVSQATEVGIQTYESHTTLWSCTPPHVRDMCHVCGLDLSCTSKQIFLSLILLIPLAELTNQKRGIC